MKTSEIEFIDNTAPGSTKIFSSVYYWTDIRSNSTVNLTETTKHTSPGFTSFYVGAYQCYMQL